MAIDDLRVPPDEVKAALDAIPAELRAALEVAHDNIVAYHRTQLQAGPAPGPRPASSSARSAVPVDRAGLYVPGGRAPLASTVLMTAAPARVAGVAELALCSPPGPDGRLAPSVLAAAAIAGVDEVYRVGGAQAIARPRLRNRERRRRRRHRRPGQPVRRHRRAAGCRRGLVGVPSAFTGPSEVAVVADDVDAGGLRGGRPGRPGRARPRRARLPDHLVGARPPPPSAPRWPG